MSKRNIFLDEDLVNRVEAYQALYVAVMGTRITFSHALRSLCIMGAEAGMKKLERANEPATNPS